MINSKYQDRQQFLATFGYDGANFFGVQEQPALPTVLGALRARVEAAGKQSARALCVSARTDRGVSAVKNFATFFFRAPVDAKKFASDVASDIGDGLRSVTLTTVSPHVHARGCSRSKRYRYTISDANNYGDEFGVTLVGAAWRVAPTLCEKKMAMAAALMVGEKDFSSLRGGGCGAGTTTKNIHYIKVERQKNREITIEISGDAFLRKMIRNMTGLLVEVGAGLREPLEVIDILNKKDRQAAGIMAPAHGLVLIDVEFISSAHIRT